jgi:hypothetical protein
VNLMTKEIRDILLESEPPHRGFGFRPVDAGDHMVLRISIENLASYSEPKRQDLALWILSLAQRIYNTGCVCIVESVKFEREL